MSAAVHTRETFYHKHGLKQFCGFKMTYYLEPYVDILETESYKECPAFGKDICKDFVQNYSRSEEERLLGA